MDLELGPQTPSLHNLGRAFGGSDDDYPTALAVSRAGHLYLAGSGASSTMRFGESHSLTNRGGTDVYLVKLEPSGNVLWVRHQSQRGRKEGSVA